jgi:trk system potassium uptake protein TrkH
MTGQGAYLAVCHSFATMATGGFSPLASSVETLNSPWSEWIITFFMLLAGMNFSLHLSSLQHRRIQFFKDDEFKFYIFTAFSISLVIAVILWSQNGYGFESGIRTSLFQTFSIITTTGFSSKDFTLWVMGAKMMLILLFFVGGCSGSTGGGIKVVRLLLMLRLALGEMKRLVHPKGVIPTRLSGSVVPVKVINSIAGFIALYLVIYFFSTALLSLAGHDFLTSFTAVGATLGNIGPGLGAVGPAANYNFFSTPIKWLEIFLMIVGRLELYSVIILFTPAYWRK